MKIPWLAIVVAGLVIPSGAVSGLAALGDVSDGRLRVVLEEGALQARAIDGEPSIDGEPIPGAWTNLSSLRVEPWRGYERTVHLPLEGHGTVWLADDASGVLVELGPEADGRNRSTEATTEEGDKAPSRGPPGPGHGDGNPSEASSSGDRPSPQAPQGLGTVSTGIDAGAGSPQEPSSEAAVAPEVDLPREEDGLDAGSVAALGVALAVGVGPWLVRNGPRLARKLPWTAPSTDPGPAGRRNGRTPRAGEAPYPWMQPPRRGRRKP